MNTLSYTVAKYIVTQFYARRKQEEKKEEVCDVCSSESDVSSSPTSVYSSSDHHEEPKSIETVSTLDSLPPPPPPPPTLGQDGVLPPPLGNIRVKTFKHKGSLRKFNADFIPRSKISKTIFVLHGIAEATLDIDIDTHEMAHNKSEKKNITRNTKNEISLIDQDRAHQNSLKLSTLRLEIEEIRKCILQMDETKISIPQLKSLISISPTEDDIKIIQRFKGDRKHFSIYEHFIDAVSDIPHFKERMEVWLYKQEFEEKLNQIRNDTKSILNSLEELKDSKKFDKFLTIVLTMCNFLNSKSKNAYGFRLCSLLKLKDTKTFDQKSNLFEYLVNFIARKHCDILHFYEDLKSVQEAKRVDVVEMNKMITMMAEGSILLDKLLEKYKNVKLPKKDIFLKKMKKFQRKSKKEFKEIQQEKINMEIRLKETITLYGEDDFKDGTFFIELDKFLTEYKLTALKVEESMKKEKLLKM